MYQDACTIMPQHIQNQRSLIVLIPCIPAQAMLSTIALCRSIILSDSVLCIISSVHQEVLVWLTALQKELGGEVSDERMRDYIWNTLKSGRVKSTINALQPSQLSFEQRQSVAS